MGGATLTLAQGPRTTGVQVDPEAAISASGSRVIFTTTQSLEEVSPEQVTVEPATEFTVDTSGRSVGVRFALPLWDDTEYTIRIDEVTGVGGGPASTLEETFTTPALQFQLLQRGEDGDTIFRSDLAGDGQSVFTHAHIEDFRATRTHLVVSTIDAGGSHLVVTDLEGGDERELPLPGDGLVGNLQSADRGDVVGYTFTDADLGADGGQESALYTASQRPADADAPPTPVVLDGGDPRVVDWRFVPGTDSILMLTFDGALNLVSGTEAVALGTAIGIDGIARGSSQAVVERIEGPVVIDLATGEEEPLAATDPTAGQVSSVTPLPGESGATLRVLAQVDGFDLLSTDVAVVDAGGAARVVASLAAEDTLLQTCVSPSGRYAALLVAPDAVDNPYDGYLLPLPERLETRIVALEDGTDVVALTGFDISWCQNGPPV
nr:hypothetical protein [Microbacterium invictum]